MEATAATAKAKRKRAAATDIAGADPAPAAVEEASDAEVEEFYAILRRIRDASRRICGAGARPAPRAPAWRPSFCWEDFATPPPPPLPPATTPPAQARPDEPAASPPPPQPRACLDLNAEPEPEAPATPRSARIPAA
ncbi:hypothetical protein HU200_001977 [Digitaria exilis]|uniref:Uncharacterized protein n=1 Tax=Digitaria exilis TaxID=1010633 RepID=A0A835G093_9POAL|nr:hypothetical protein HU200_001977 [Digitaria exilis]CAB3476430.1 unnamed protein product [Digitaria exilis]